MPSLFSIYYTKCFTRLWNKRRSNNRRFFIWKMQISSAALNRSFTVIMSKTQSLNDAAVRGCCLCVPRHLPKIVGCVGREKKQWIYVSSSLIFCESLLRQVATPFCNCTCSLRLNCAISVLMWGIFYDNVFEAKLCVSPRCNFQSTWKSSFNVSQRLVNRGVLSTRRESTPKLQPYENTIVVMKSLTELQRL